MDPNRNRSAVAFDALGMVVGTAVMGKPPPAPAEGDSLDGFEPDLTDAVTLRHLDPLADPTDPLSDPHTILGRATTRLVYDLFAYQRTNEKPAVVYTLARETHHADLDLATGQQSKIQRSFSYSDGFGREIQKKIQAEPEIPGGPLRWVGSGWTVFNNKGKPVRQYEPFFTDAPCFEFDVCIGVSPILLYDPVERVVATLHPNHTWEKVVFDPWMQATWDVNDTVSFDPGNDAHFAGFLLNPDGTPRLPTDEYLPTWHALRTNPALADEAWPDPKFRTAEGKAAEKTAIHAETPTIAHFDSLGRAFLTDAHNKFKRNDSSPEAPPSEEHHFTRVIFDIEGNQREVIDAKGRIVMRYDYSIAGPEQDENGESTNTNQIHQASMEAGERWMLNDVAGNPIRAWDSRNHQFLTTYDQLRRPIESYMIESAEPLLVEQTVYGETGPNPETNNLRGQVVQFSDQAGVVTSDDYDFKGNLLSSRRQLAQEYNTTLDWSAAVPLETPIYTSRTRYDALNRPIQLTAPHSDQAGTKINVIQPIYNEANLLEQVNAWLNQSAEPTDLLDPATANLNAVTDIDYDAKGQRTLIYYGNGVRTTYKYDPLTFRLTHLQTVRGRKDTSDCTPVFDPRTCEDPPAVCERLQSAKCILQDLTYTYDPVGNITHIYDSAQQIIYFQNKRVEPSASYTYDALYRLSEATGREHLGQVGGKPIRHSYNDWRRTRRSHPCDGNAMGRYTERYEYDKVGNFQRLWHGADNGIDIWQRTYSYDEQSLIPEDAAADRKNNRLTKTTISGSGLPATDELYTHDAHGNMLSMPHLHAMQWDFKDQLSVTQRQIVNEEDEEGVQHHGERTYYVYDAGGQRVRKVTESASEQLKDERIYLGAFEIYRKQGTNAVIRETLHVMDDQQRIALVETRIQGDDGSPPQLIRYQFGNHLGSASLEVDHEAKIISYEEYYPYGSTSYQAVRNDIQLPLKRYRYSGKERDEESGLYYHGACYYAPWLGRWTACDSAGFLDGVSLYPYVRNNPINLSDPSGHGGEETTGEAFYEFGMGWVASSGEMMEGMITNPADVLGGLRLLTLYIVPTREFTRRQLMKRLSGKRSEGFTGFLISAHKHIDPAWAFVESAKSLRAAIVEDDPLKAGYQAHRLAVAVVDILPVPLFLKGKGGIRGTSSNKGRVPRPVRAGKNELTKPKKVNPSSESPVGPTYSTYEEIISLMKAGKIRKEAHILGVFVKNPKGNIIAKWFEISELDVGIKKQPLLGHTEQKALYRIKRMNLEVGSTIEFVGSEQPCNLPLGCSQAMTKYALETGVDVRYRHVYNAEKTGRTIHEFTSSEGRITQKERREWLH